MPILLPSEKLGDPILDDFKNFQYLCLRSMLSVDPTPLQYDMGEYLAYGPNLRIIEAFRGASKSWQTSFLVSWLVLRDWVHSGGKPQINVLVVSGTKDKADGFSNFTRELFYAVDVLRPLVPKNPNRWSSVAFDVEGAKPGQVNTVASRAVLGRITGDRADYIIGDDLELPQNAETQGQRDKLSRRVAEFMNVLKPEGGQIIILGTPHTEDSLYNRLPQQGYDRRIWPAKYPELDKIKHYGDDLAPFVAQPLERDPSLVGKPTEPHRFDEVELQKRESAGRSVFALQWMLDTTLSDEEKYPLKLRDLITMDLDPQAAPEHPIWSGDTDYKITNLHNVGFPGDSFQKPMGFRDGSKAWSPFDQVILALDPSGRGADETSWAVLASMGGFVYLLECSGDVRGYDEKVLARVAKSIKKFDVSVIVYEDNFGDGMFGNILQSYLDKQGMVVAIESVKHSTMKEARLIDTMEPVMNAHRLVVDTSVVKNDHPPENVPEADGTRYRLFHQMTRVHRVRGALVHDDRLEAVAMGVKFFTNIMTTVQDQFIADRQLQDNLDAVDDFWADIDATRAPSRPIGGLNHGLNYRGM